MKTHSFVLTCAGFLAALLFVSPACAQVLRIMPVGDSITEGAGGTGGIGGYRGPLWDLLVAEGYAVDYVGSHQTNSALLTDMDHSGYGGWTIGQIDTNIGAWLAAIDPKPDIMLLHIGTNNFGGSNPGAIDELETLLGTIATASPDTHVILTNLMERGEPANGYIQTEFNPHVEPLVDFNVATYGDKISFLDMRAAVPLSDMPDNLHPNDAGYQKMAAAWLGAIEGVIEPADDVPPSLVSAVGAPSLDEVSVTFNRKLDQTTAETAGNYTIDLGVNVLSAVLSVNQRVVTLTTTPQTESASYTLTVSNVQDQVTPTPNTIAPGSTVPFFAATAPGYFNNVDESDCFTLLYSLDIPTGANYGGGVITYDTDNSGRIGQFDRVAYYMELQKSGENLQYAWVSMDPFSSNLAELGVPVLGTGATFQQFVSNMNVVSNVPTVVEGEGITTGNIEFWPTNYNGANSLPVPNADGGEFDFGDNPTAGNYGSMQIHNHDIDGGGAGTTGQTVIAFNSWGGNGGNADIGIGPNTGAGRPDYTFADNSGDYVVKRLQVLVRTTGDVTPPSLASAQSSYGLGSILVTFDEPVRPETLVATNFSIDNGVSVLGVTLRDDLREILLTTTLQPEGVPLTLTVSDVRDSSPNANLIAPGSTIGVDPPALPAEVTANVGAAADDYQLVYSVDIPNNGTFNNGNPYTRDNSANIGTFERVAYYLELQAGAGPVEYVWTSMDPFTTNLGQLKVPTVATGGVFQQFVTNLDVISNVATNATAAGGNIEFWPSNYAPANSLPVPGASETTLDFGDSGAAGNAGHGCMQVHNTDLGETAFALNHFGNDGLPISVGIGNRSTSHPDWTFAYNAGGYTRKVLHIMVLPTPPPPPTPAPAGVLANVAEASDYGLVYSMDLPANGNLSGGAGYPGYSFDDSARTDEFSRIAYYLELDGQWVWVSMEAFSRDRNKLGVPNVASGAFWQLLVNDMNVVSSPGAVTNGTGIATGNIEFWPSNYGGQNDIGIPNAGGGFDFGDGGAGTGGGHGSMQVHNHDIDGTGAGLAGETLFAINHFGGNNNTGNLIAMGIGNDPALVNGATDWTFNYNSNTYTTRTLHVLVKAGPSPIPPPPLTGPAFAWVNGSTTLNRLVVRFDREVADSSADPGNFSIDGGLTVTGATILPGNREIALTTSPQTGGQVYTVTASNVIERSAAGTPSLPGANIAFTAYSPPAALANIPGSDTGYELIYHLEIPAAKPQWNLNQVTYNVDEAQYGERLFDRVAYLMELDGNWVYASFDPHTNQIAQTGVPSLQVSGTPFQQLVTNMNVASNMDPGTITTGTGITSGNIEFWGGNYDSPNALGIPNASAATFDFGDVMTGGAYGSMQVHNHDIDGTTGQVLFAYNNWGGNAGGNSVMGLGTQPTGQPDWTFNDNGGTYTTRNLYVFARPGGVATGPAPEIYSHPCDHTASTGQDVTFAVLVDGAGPFTYQWRLNGAPISGATQAWLELSSVSAADIGGYDVVVTGSNLVSTTSLTGLLDVSGSNVPPTFSGYAFSVQQDGGAVIPLAAILANANDTDGGTPELTAADASSAQGGGVSLGASDLTYTAPAGYTGSDSFGVTIEDGQGGSVPGTITVTVTFQAVLVGGPDTIAFLPGGGPGAGEIEGVFHGVPGQEYGFQRSLELLLWENLGSAFAGDDGVIIFNDPAPPTPDAYYRTITPPPSE